MDEDSMAGHPFWGWFKHRLEKFRKIKLKIDEDLNIQPIFHDKRTELIKRIFGGISAFYSMGDVNQLPPIAMKAIADDSNLFVFVLCYVVLFCLLLFFLHYFVLFYLVLFSLV